MFTRRSGLLGFSDKDEIIGSPLLDFFIEETAWHQYRKKMCEQGHKKMISIGQLAAGIAHEINTPLGIILGHTQLLEEDGDEHRIYH